MRLVRPRVIPTGLGSSTGRDSLVLKAYEPAPIINTGVLGGPDSRAGFTVVSGTVTHSTPNTYTNTWFQGIVNRRSAGLKYNNCWFSDRLDCDDTTNAYFDTEVTDCSFAAETCTNVDHEYGIVGYGFKAVRPYIRRFKDGVRIRNRGGTAANAKVWGAYIDELLWWADDPFQTDGTHNDGIQIEGGTGFEVIGCSIHGRSSQTLPFGDQNTQVQSTSALMYTDNVNDMNGVVDGNWLYGGEVTVNASKPSLSGVDIGSIINNKWARDFLSNSFNINSNLIYTFTNNIYTDNSASVVPHVAS